MGLILGGVPPHDLILDGQSVSLYVGGSPPVKVWPTGPMVVQITLGTGNQARDQFRAALTARGLNYQTVVEVPFEIDLVGEGWLTNMFQGCVSLTSVPDMDTSSVTGMAYMFNGCAALTSVPDMDTSQVTGMSGMFNGCSSLSSVPAMDTAQVTNMEYMFNGCSSLSSVPAMDTAQVTSMDSMFYGCSSLTSVPAMDTAQVLYMYDMFYNCAALTDGNVRLIGRHPDVDTTGMITGSGLTREPFFNPDGTPDDGIIIEVYEVSLTDVSGRGVIHPLLTVTVPAGETWDVRIQGTMTQASSTTSSQPQVRIGSMTFGPYGQGEAVDCSGTVTSADNTIAIITNAGTSNRASFVGTVTIEK